MWRRQLPQLLPKKGFFREAFFHCASDSGITPAPVIRRDAQNRFQSVQD
jgi:hypothetical protein